MRAILNSRTYQLASLDHAQRMRPTPVSIRTIYARRLPAEVLLDALCQSTEVPEAFPGYPLGIRAGQLPDPTLKSYFLSVFGRSERVTRLCLRTQRRGDLAAVVAYSKRR